MNEYISMWKNYVNFNDRTNLRGYWTAFLFNIIAAVALGIISGIIPILGMILGTLYSLAGLLPGLGLTVRRLKDTGRPWYHIFFGCIPLAGAIILIIFLTRPSIPDDGTPVV
ncbi:DUF805 domain-containing protein [Clostridia bacterium]|nr:DUF805 domain-containing protein [Clostridia bacterium]